MSKVDLLLDGDLFLYKAACGVEKEVVWDEENHVLWSNLEDAWGCLVENIEKVMNNFDVVNHVIALSGKGNFRKELSTTYKTNRQGARKPLCYSDLCDRLKEHYNVVSYDRLEADDVLGILATKPSNRPRIIVSDDKDMRTVPCSIYANGAVTVVSEAEADYNHMYQTLVGDTADGYPGCPGIGPVKASKILNGARLTKSMWPLVRHAFEQANLTEEDALTQARLARILRNEDWNSDKKEPILWTPTVN